MWYRDELDPESFLYRLHPQGCGGSCGDWSRVWNQSQLGEWEIRHRPDHGVRLLEVLSIILIINWNVLSIFCLFKSILHVGAWVQYISVQITVYRDIFRSFTPSNNIAPSWICPNMIAFPFKNKKKKSLKFNHWRLGRNLWKLNWPKFPCISFIWKKRKWRITCETHLIRHALGERFCVGLV